MALETVNVKVGSVCWVDVADDFERERRRRAQIKLLARTASERSVLDVWL